MQIQTNLAERIEHDRDVKLTRAGIKSDNPHFYWHLVDTLYSDKWGAVVRELTANALDEHDKFKITRPIEVQAPTTLDPNLVIRDFAKGMSNKMILERYMMLADSTKSLDDTQRGGFGLGCKTPFAVCTMFTVESFQYGNVHTYVMMRGRDPEWTGPEDMAPEVPLIRDLGSFPTDEPDGLRVTIPVEGKNHREVTERIQNICWRYQPQPISNVRFETLEYIIERPEYKLRKRSRNYGSNHAMAMIGNIAYRIDAAPLNLTYHDKRRLLLDAPLEINFEIGEINPALNREGLSYKPKVVEAIKDRLQLIQDDLYNQIQEQVNTKNSIYEATVYYFLNVPTEIQGLLDSSRLKWRDCELRRYIELKANDATFAWLSEKDLRRKNIKVGSYLWEVNIDPNNLPTIIWLPEDADYSDAEIGRRLTHWRLSQTNLKKVLIICSDKAKLDAYLNEKLGGLMTAIEFNDTNFPKAPPKPKSSTPTPPRKKLAKFHTWTSRGFVETEVDLDREGGGVFFQVKNWEVLDGRISQALAREMADIFLRQEPVFVPATFSLKHPNWKNALDLLKEVAAKLSKEPETLRMIHINREVSTFTSDTAKIVRRFRRLDPELKILKPRSVFGRFYAKVQECEEFLSGADFHRIQTLSSMMTVFDIKYTPKTVLNLNELANKVYETYPLLEHLSRNGDADELPPFVAYINAL